MNHEMEEHRCSNPQDTVDAEKSATSGAAETHETNRAELEEQFRKECRKTCRRNFWIELFKTVAKVAGVVLAAFGLSSFNEED